MHEPFEGLGTIEKWALQHHHHLSCTQLFAGDALPDASDFDWLIIMGGGMNIYQEDKYPWLKDEKLLIMEAFKTGKMILGICLGAQLIADMLGAKVYRGAYKEIGWFPVFLTNEAISSPLFKGVPDELTVFHWHGDTFDLPEGAVSVAYSAITPCQGFLYNDRVLALQFHYEVDEELVKGMVKNGSDELDHSPFVQNAPEILGDPGKIEFNNGIMHEILDAFVHLNTSTC
jgi:GMP synthase (glutamine-hydrolysing)